MTTAKVLDLFKDVRHVRANKYVARCPAHSDPTARLSIRIEADGRWEFHCWGGCSTHDVLMALSKNEDHIFPVTTMTSHYLKPIPVPFDEIDALAGLCPMLQEAYIYSDQQSKGHTLSEAAMKRLAVMSQHFQSAHTYVTNLL